MSWWSLGLYVSFVCFYIFLKLPKFIQKIYDHKNDIIGGETLSRLIILITFSNLYLSPFLDSPFWFFSTSNHPFWTFDRIVSVTLIGFYIFFDIYSFLLEEKVKKKSIHYKQEIIDHVGYFLKKEFFDNTQNTGIKIPKNSHEDLYVGRLQYKHSEDYNPFIQDDNTLRFVFKNKPKNDLIAYNTLIKEKSVLIKTKLSLLYGFIISFIIFSFINSLTETLFSSVIHEETYLKILLFGSAYILFLENSWKKNISKDIIQDTFRIFENSFSEKDLTAHEKLNLKREYAKSVFIFKINQIPENQNKLV